MHRGDICKRGGSCPMGQWVMGNGSNGLHGGKHKQDGRSVKAFFAVNVLKTHRLSDLHINFQNFHGLTPLKLCARGG